MQFHTFKHYYVIPIIFKNFGGFHGEIMSNDRSLCSVPIRWVLAYKKE